MIKIESIEKAFAYSAGRLDLETGEIGGERVEREMEQMKTRYCSYFLEEREFSELPCPNFYKCRFHPIPNHCTFKFTTALTETLSGLSAENLLQDIQEVKDSADMLCNMKDEER